MLNGTSKLGSIAPFRHSLIRLLIKWLCFSLRSTDSPEFQINETSTFSISIGDFLHVFYLLFEAAVSLLFPYIIFLPRMFDFDAFQICN